MAYFYIGLIVVLVFVSTTYLLGLAPKYNPKPRISPTEEELAAINTFPKDSEHNEIKTATGDVSAIMDDKISSTTLYLDDYSWPKPKKTKSKKKKSTKKKKNPKKTKNKSKKK
jgi:hypothetical protein